MYQPMLALHWKQIRLALIPFMIASFGLPLVTVHWLGAMPAGGAFDTTAYQVMAQTRVWMMFYPLLAAAIGVTLALSAWNWDHQLGHVYALSLPIPRWEYAALKMGAGAALALLPAGALWVGALLASASVTLPTGLHAYPTLLAVRFLAAILLAYAVLFAMAAGTIRTTVWVVATIAAIIVAASLLNNPLATHFPILQQTSLVQLMVKTLGSLPGPFHVFAGNWALIDV